jgi:hypothetical protein
VKKTGELSLASNGKCDKGEKKLTIAKQGPAGVPGPQGSVGPAGSAPMPEAVHYVTGPANDQCFEAVGTFCRNTGSSIGWENLAGYGDAGFYRDPSGAVPLVGVVNYGSSGGGSGGFVPEGPFYLPAGYRPSSAEVFLAPKSPGGGFTTTAPVEIKPSGVIVISAATNYAFGLGGITFRP